MRWAAAAAAADALSCCRCCLSCLASADGERSIRNPGTGVRGARCAPAVGAGPAQGQAAVQGPRGQQGRLPVPLALSPHPQLEGPSMQQRLVLLEIVAPSPTRLPLLTLLRLLPPLPLPLLIGPSLPSPLQARVTELQANHAKEVEELLDRNAQLQQQLEDARTMSQARTMPRGFDAGRPAPAALAFDGQVRVGIRPTQTNRLPRSSAAPGRCPGTGCGGPARRSEQQVSRRCCCWCLSGCHPCCRHWTPACTRCWCSPDGRK